VEFTNESIVYKQPMLAGDTFGFESMVTNLYHSKATANTMAEVVQLKKSLMIRIFEAFPQFETLFWKSHIFQCYKMFVKKDDITYRIGHFQ
jgi:CRP-like cAMP-binding protein